MLKLYGKRSSSRGELKKIGKNKHSQSTVERARQIFDLRMVTSDFKLRATVGGFVYIC